MSKSTYVNARHKKYIREYNIPVGSHVIGLPGPDFLDYVRDFKTKGYKRLDLFENEPSIFVKQANDLQTLNPLGITLSFGNILQAPLLQDVFYDMDLCCQIITAKEIVQKFNIVPTIFTFSEMMVKKFSTIPIFLEYVGEDLQRVYQINDNEQLVITNKHNYSIKCYCDTSPMITIKNF